MLSRPVKYLKNYLENDVKPKLKDMIKNFSSKLKEEFVDMLNKTVKFFFQIFNDFVSKVFSFIEMIKGIAKSKGFGLKYVTVSFEPPGFGQIDVFGFSLPIPKVSLPKVEINFEMGLENERTTNTTTDNLSFRKEDINEKALKLLLDRRIDEFNEIRNNGDFLQLCLSSAYLRSAYLHSANLSNANLSDANLEYSDLSSANLYLTNLSNANLSNANLSNANLTYANIYTDVQFVYPFQLFYQHFYPPFLSSANLSNANLSFAILQKPSLNNANLSSADLSNSIIIDPYFQDLKIDENTTFYNAIIDNPEFIDYIIQFTGEILQKIENKRELKNKLEERNFKQEYIHDLLQFSILPY